MVWWGILWRWYINLCISWWKDAGLPTSTKAFGGYVFWLQHLWGWIQIGGQLCGVLNVGSDVVGWTCASSISSWLARSQGRDARWSSQGLHWWHCGRFWWFGCSIPMAACGSLDGGGLEILQGWKWRERFVCQVHGVSHVWSRVWWGHWWRWWRWCSRRADDEWAWGTSSTDEAWESSVSYLTVRLRALLFCHAVIWWCHFVFRKFCNRWNYSYGCYSGIFIDGATAFFICIPLLEVRYFVEWADAGMGKPRSLSHEGIYRPRLRGHFAQVISEFCFCVNLEWKVWRLETLTLMFILWPFCTRI